jgi:transcriptional regulator with XRE-family HTH domain
MIVAMHVPTILRDARLRAGLGQAELARRAGTSQATVSAYESGRKTPSVATLDRLLAVTGSRLAVERRRPRAVEPSPLEMARRAKTLLAVLELAEALPTRHEPELRFPRLR